MLDIVEQKCRVCGCTEMQACPGGCYWVTPDLCSACQVDERDANAVVACSGGLLRIAQERLRQLAEENYSVEGDLGYSQNELAMAAASYAMPRSRRVSGGRVSDEKPWTWPWGAASWKPSPDTTDGRIRELEKAGALIAAEIDRLLAAEPSHGE